MFYPFNATMACAASKTFVDKTKSETEILRDAYKEIAHVYISRVAERGGFKTYIYVPFEVRQLLTDLEESGFVVRRIEGNRYSVCWGDYTPI